MFRVLYYVNSCFRGWLSKVSFGVLGSKSHGAIAEPLDEKDLANVSDCDNDKRCSSDIL